MDIMCKSGKFWKVVNLYKEMKRKRIKFDVVVYNIVICVIGVLEGVDFGVRVFKEMKERGCEFNVVIYNMVIKFLCEEGRVKDVYGMFNEMFKRGC